MNIKHCVITTGVVGVLGILPLAAAPSQAAAMEDAFEAARELGRGINLGNMLEAPHEGDWGVSFDKAFPVLIREAGFNHVRIPVRWSAHMSNSNGMSVQPAFMKRVRGVVDECLSNDLRVVLNVHHFEDIHTDPVSHTNTLQHMWACIAREFFAYPAQLYFELLNEPHGELTTQRWNQMFPKILREIRRRHPRRCVIVGPGKWNSHEELRALRLPSDDQFLIATCHYYEPFDFTHQGAEWLKAAAPPVGRRFPATKMEVRSIAEDFDAIVRWSRENRRPIYIGEFGSYSKAAMPDRVYWTGVIARHAKQHELSWAYWEFCSTFGVYNVSESHWNRDLLHQLIPIQTGD